MRHTKANPDRSRPSDERWVSDFDVEAIARAFVEGYLHEHATGGTLVGRRGRYHHPPRLAGSDAYREHRAALAREAEPGLHEDENDRMAECISGVGIDDWRIVNDDAGRLAHCSECCSVGVLGLACDCGGRCDSYAWPPFVDAWNRAHGAIVRLFAEEGGPPPEPVAPCKGCEEIHRDSNGKARGCGLPGHR